MEKKKCDECGKRVRRIHRLRDKFLCYWCYMKHQTMIPLVMPGNEKEDYNII